jgi:hypothetical protein
MISRTHNFLLLVPNKFPRSPLLSFSLHPPLFADYRDLRSSKKLAAQDYLFLHPNLNSQHQGAELQLTGDCAIWLHTGNASVRVHFLFRLKKSSLGQSQMRVHSGIPIPHAAAGERTSARSPTSRLALLCLSSIDDFYFSFPFFLYKIHVTALAATASSRRHPGILDVGAADSPAARQHVFYFFYSKLFILIFFPCTVTFYHNHFVQTFMHNLST